MTAKYLAKTSQPLGPTNIMSIPSVHMQEYILFKSIFHIQNPLNILLQAIICHPNQPEKILNLPQCAATGSSEKVPSLLSTTTTTVYKVCVVLVNL